MLVVAVAGLAILVAVARYGAVGVLMLGLLGATLVPATTASTGQVPTIGGVDTTTIRTVVLTAVIIGMLLTVDVAVLKQAPVAARRLIFWFVALGLLGLPVAIATASGGTVHAVAQAAGQPLIYAATLAVFLILLRTDASARDRLAAAWAAALVLEAVIGLEQYLTGGAFDVLRGYTRVTGTMGSDFLGLFSASGLFATLWMRSIASTAFLRRLATAAAAACVLMIALALARTAVVGVAAGILYLIVRGAGSVTGRRRLATGIAIAVALGCGLYAAQGLWSARSNATATSSFDRAASWVSGWRVATDHPLAGVGPLNVADVVASSPRYSSNEYGTTSANPHNVWIFAMAAEGFPYAIVLIAVSVTFVLGLRRLARRPADEYLVASIIVAGVGFTVNNLFTHLEIILYMLLAAAILWTRDARGAHRVEPG